MKLKIKKVFLGYGDYLKSIPKGYKCVVLVQGNVEDIETVRGELPSVTGWNQCDDMFIAVDRKLKFRIRESLGRTTIPVTFGEHHFMLRRSKRLVEARKASLAKLFLKIYYLSKQEKKDFTQEIEEYATSDELKSF